MQRLRSDINMITNNATLGEIGQILAASSKTLIFVHQNPDGDAIGSATGLCRALRRMGQEAFVLLEDKVPEYLAFMDTSCCTLDRGCIADPDVCICVDCSGESRFETIADVYNSGKQKLCIDHHENDLGFGDRYYISSETGATAELIFLLLQEMQQEIDKDIAECIFIGISMDTGNFKYSNTTPQTHRIAAELLAKGIDQNSIMVNLYQNVRIQEFEIKNKILANKELFAGGKGAIARVTQAMLDSCSAELGDAETSIDALRDIAGVEIAVVLKEKGDRIKVSFRAKTDGDVGCIAQSMGGGGHKKASGCTLDMSMEEAYAKVKEAVEEALK